MTTVFDPITVGAWTLPQRFVMAPLTRNRAEAGGVPGDLARELPVVLPAHPRLQARMADRAPEGVLVIGALGYVDFLGLTDGAALVVTDSGGVQEETTVLGVPCITLRENTERPITVDEGTNTIVGVDPAAITACYEDVLSSGGKSGRIPQLWDGAAAERIVAVINAWATP